MAKINLLPWREELREQRKKEFITLGIATLLLSALLSGLLWMFLNNRLHEQESANKIVTDANGKLDTELASLKDLQKHRDEIIARMKVIQDLQGKRPVSVRIFDEVPRMVPPNVYLTRFARTGDKFTIEGKADSPNDVSTLIRNLEASPWFRNVFMNSFQAAPPPTTTPAAGGVLPRPEQNYGQFILSLDLEDPEENAGKQVQAGTGLRTPPSVTPAAITGMPISPPPVVNAGHVTPRPATVPTTVIPNPPVSVATTATTVNTIKVTSAPVSPAPVVHANLPPVNAAPAATNTTTTTTVITAPAVSGTTGGKTP